MLLTCLIGNKALLCLQWRGIGPHLSASGKFHGFSRVAAGTWGTFSCGFLIPFALCVYLLVKAGWSMDLVRAFSGTILTASAILLLEIFLPSKTPEDIIIDNVYLYGVLAGVIAYALGRIRRNAFVCSVFGITLASVAVHVYNMIKGVPSTLSLGGGGAFDSIVLSVLIAVGLAELIGKTAEIVVGKEEKAYDFEAGEFVESDHLTSEEKSITDVFQSKVEVEEVEDEK